MTHRHRDHLDERGAELTPRDVPVLCQPEDESALRELGLDARSVDDEIDLDGLRIVRVPARHGSGAMAEALAPVSGFVLDDVYLAGDTVWYEGVEETIARFRPRVAVVNAGGACFEEGGLIVMGIDDVSEVAERVPVVVAVHMEALNHCFLARADLRAALPSVVVPEDGETVDLSISSARPGSARADPGRADDPRSSAASRPGRASSRATYFRWKKALIWAIV